MRILEIFRSWAGDRNSFRIVLNSWLALAVLAVMFFSDGALTQRSAVAIGLCVIQIIDGSRRLDRLRDQGNVITEAKP